MDFIKKIILAISQFFNKKSIAGIDGINILKNEILTWRSSPERTMQLKGEMYYEGVHDILARKRTVIGEGGELQEVTNLPNNRIIDNQYAKLVNQKANYLLGQPFVVSTDNIAYMECLKQIFNKKFMRNIKKAGKFMLNTGMAWIYPNYDSSGQLNFKIFSGYEILPFWEDDEKTRVRLAVRVYKTDEYTAAGRKTEVERAEVYTPLGVYKFILNGETIESDNTTPYSTYVNTDNDSYNWGRIPLVPLKYHEGTPLIKRVKSLQDGINIMLSDFENNMQEDARNTILVIRNYDGQDLGEFRQKLALYGAVKVKSNDSEKGGVDTLEVKVNVDNYKAIIDIFKKALIENGMGYDAKDDRMSGNPNQMNIQSMYSDIDLDANDMETELQAAFEELLWFVKVHLSNMGYGDFENEEATITFNRDILINETEAIESCVKSVGILSDETIIEQHPWVDDVQKELERIKKQKEEQMQDQYGAFVDSNAQSEGGDVDAE